MAVLTIYTNSFPYGSAENFLESEIACLSLHFQEILIVPFSISGEARLVPDNVKTLEPVQEGNWSKLKIYLTGILNFYRILDIPELKNELKFFPVFKCLKYLGYGVLTRNRISAIIQDKSSVQYSYWLGFSTFALTLLKLEGKVKTVITRAHGYDLYEERGEQGLAFIKAATLKNIDRVFFISDHGCNYLLKKYPGFSDKFEVSRLGTSDPGFLNPKPSGTNITIVSCSAINPNKRISLILESLISFLSKYPEITVIWYHIGSGPGFKQLKDLAEKSLNNTSIQWNFLGQLSGVEVFNFYRSVSVNMFVNVSESEGVPVSIMEAQSCGIPVLATPAGGTPEIVNGKNGFLLALNPLPEEVADAIYDVVINNENWERRRILSRKNWEAKFNSYTNFTAFANILISLSKPEKHTT